MSFGSIDKFEKFHKQLKLIGALTHDELPDDNTASWFLNHGIDEHCCNDGVLLAIYYARRCHYHAQPGEA